MGPIARVPLLRKRFTFLPQTVPLKQSRRTSERSTNTLRILNRLKDSSKTSTNFSLILRQELSLRLSKPKQMRLPPKLNMWMLERSKTKPKKTSTSFMMLVKLLNSIKTTPLLKSLEINCRSTELMSRFLNQLLTQVML